jgi:D-inositol-3-phosphate glycosyltransferase
LGKSKRSDSHFHDVPRGGFVKIAMVSEHASPLAALGGVDAGGQNVHVAALSAELARRGHDVSVYTRRDDPGLPDTLSFEGVTVHHVDAGPPETLPKDELLPYMDEFGDRLLDAWSLDRPDIAHAHFWMSGLATRNATRPLGIPFALTFHALGVVKRRHQGAKDTSPSARIELERDLARSTHLIIATCTDEVFELTRQGVHAGRVRVVPCGVDLSLFTPDGPVEPRDSGLRRIVIVTRLVERKGVGNVIEALADVPATELVVAGGPEKSALASDPELKRLRALARTHGVGRRVQFRGGIARSEIPPLLRSADVVACVPWYEPFGIVPLEAMACGVPVLASAVGGLIDTVVDGVTGIHVPPRCPERIAESLRYLLEDDQMRTRLGRAAAARARERYSWSRVADSTVRAYTSVLVAQRARASEAVS